MIAESRSKSRFAIAKRRAMSHQAFRHNQKQIIIDLLKKGEGNFDFLLNAEKALRVKSWRKWSDSPLGEFITVLLRTRKFQGTNKELKISEILKEAERLFPKQWRSFRWGIPKAYFEEIIIPTINKK